MTLANVIWAVNLALEIACLWRLVSIRSRSPLTAFIGWQIVIDAVLPLLRTPLGADWTYLYWFSHSVNYVMLLFLFMPVRFRTLSGTYWLASLTLTILAISNMWLYEPWKQYVLAVVCGGLALFTAIVTYAFNGRWLPRATWIGIALWASGQTVAAAFPRLYGTVYPIACAFALAFFWLGTHAPYTAYVTSAATRVDTVRLPLPNRYNRGLLGWALEH